MSLARTGFIPLPPGRRAGLRPRRCLGSATRRGCYVRRAHRRRPRRRHRLQDADLSALDSPTYRVSPAFSSTRSTTCSSRPTRLLHASAFSAAPTRCLLGRVDRRAASRTDSPTTASGGGSTPSTSASRLGEGCTRLVVDIDSMTSIAEIALCQVGRRWAVYDAGERPRLRQHPRPGADRADRPRSSAAIVSSIDVPIAGPHGLWVDGERLYCAADGGALVVIDRDSGERPSFALPLPGVPDVVYARRPRPTASTSRSASPAPSPSSTRRARTDRDSHDGAGCAHARLGSGGRDALRVLPRELRRRALRRRRRQRLTLGGDARRILARPGAAGVRLRTRQRPDRRHARRPRPLGRPGRPRPRALS